MMARGTAAAAALGLLWLSASAAFAQDPAEAPVHRGSSALFDYVAEPDPAYRWEVVDTLTGNPATTFVVRLTSQSWRNSDEVDRTLWEHWLIVVKPPNPVPDQAFLFISGGSNESGPPDKPSDIIARIAEATNSVVAELKMVPNQPLVFHGDGVKRSEDDLIGYAWDQYLKTGDKTWLPRLPMVKSAVRAMDCVQELTASDAGGKLAIERFVVAGGSKRGWTTWMTGAADKRVAAIVPIVIDVVNVEPSMRHHLAVYGFWTEAIGNYVEHGIMRRWGNPRLTEIYEVVDPYYHLDRLAMPKYIVNASGDEFFCPDSSQFYYDALQGEKHLRYVPNAGHSLRDTDAVETIAAFYGMVLADRPRPKYEWSFGDDGSIQVAATDRPREVKVWQATNPAARDFRLKTIGPCWTSEDLAEQGNGTYVARVETPEQGWTAFFVELTYDSGGPLPLKVTSAVRVLPDRLPHADILPNEALYELEIRSEGE